MAENSWNNFNDSTNSQIFNFNLWETVWVYGIRISHNIILVNMFPWWKFIIFHLCAAQLWIAVYPMSESVKKSHKHRTTKLWVIYAVTMVLLKFRLHLILLPKYLELIRHAWLTRYNFIVSCILKQRYYLYRTTIPLVLFRKIPCCFEKKLPKISKNKLENK